MTAEPQADAKSSETAEKIPFSINAQLSEGGTIPEVTLKKRGESEKEKRKKNLNPSALLNVDEPLQAAAAVITQDGLIDRRLRCLGEGG